MPTGDSTGATDEPVSAGQCPTCATANDLFFTFCRNCLEELPDASGASSPIDRQRRRERDGNR